MYKMTHCHHRHHHFLKKHELVPQSLHLHPTLIKLVQRYGMFGHCIWCTRRQNSTFVGNSRWLRASLWIFSFGYISVFDKHAQLNIYHTTVTGAVMPKMTLVVVYAKIRDGAGRHFGYGFLTLSRSPMTVQIFHAQIGLLSYAGAANSNFS